MKRRSLVILVGMGVLVLLPIVFVGVQRIGPTAAVPATDPIVALNAEHTQGTATAEAYAAASAALTGEPSDNWRRGWHFGEPLPAEAADWLAQNTEALTLSGQAAEMEAFWSPVQRDQVGMASLGDVQKQIRTLARLWYARAGQAAATHDLDGFQQALLTIRRMGDHIQTPPLPMARMIAIALDAMAIDPALQPFGWPDVSPEALQDYSAAIAPLLEPPPSLSSSFQFEQNETVWTFSQTKVGPGGGAALRFLVPPSRLAGEMADWQDALSELADAPVEVQLDPNSAARQKVEAMAAETPGMFNFSGRLANMLMPSMERAVELRARLITAQRGVRTALAIFAYQREHGAFPESLDAIADDFTIDPFTGEPFIYRLTEDGFTLYSAGYDRDDDGGKHDRRFGESRDDSVPDDGDYVFWPIPRE